MTADLAIFLAILSVAVGALVWVAKQARSGEKARREHAEDEQEEVEQVLEDREAFDAAFRASRGRAHVRVREYLDRLRQQRKG